jgi:hypothetical protein
MVPVYRILTRDLGSAVPRPDPVLEQVLERPIGEVRRRERHAIRNGYPRSLLDSDNCAVGHRIAHKPDPGRR